MRYHLLTAVALCLAACGEDPAAASDAGTNTGRGCTSTMDVCYVAESSDGEVSCLPESTPALMEAGLIKRGFSATAPDGVARTAVYTENRPLPDACNQHFECCSKTKDQEMCRSNATSSTEAVCQRNVEAICSLADQDAGADMHDAQATPKKYAKCCYRVCYGPYE